MNLSTIRDFTARNKDKIVDTGIIVGTTVAGIGLSIVISNMLSKSDNKSSADSETASETSDIPNTND